MDRDEDELARALMHVAVVGGGWAGLAAAVEATARGHEVTLFEMAPQLGGRARRVDSHGLALDNGQHILIGAYTETLRLMQLVGAEPERNLLRIPLVVEYPDGRGLTLPRGEPRAAFARAVLGRAGWRWRDRFALLLAAAGWARRGFACAADLSVAQLTAQLPSAVRAELIDPLCVAALNTPASHASASVFLRVLHDALFSGPGSADLLLPRLDLGALWPDAAARWLGKAGARLHMPRRVERLERSASGWLLDGEPFDAVVLAASAVEAIRLAGPIAPGWAESASAIRYEPIVTVTLRSAGTRLTQAMLALHATPSAPAQFVFDLGQLRGLHGVLGFVISGARAWVERGQEAVAQATLAQARLELGAQLRGPLEVMRVLTEKRATFVCAPGLQRPPQRIADGLFAAGDYVAGPYPATLEGAVRSGIGACARISGAKISDEKTAPPAARR